MDNTLVTMVAKSFFDMVRGDTATASNEDKYHVINQVATMFVDLREPQHLIEKYTKFYDLPNKDIKDFSALIAKLGHSNLMYQGRFYYHPWLQYSNSRVILKQLDTGEWIDTSNEAFYIKLKTYVDLDDVLGYYYNKFQPTNRYEARDVAALEKLYQQANSNLDLVMYTIDLVFYHRMVDDLPCPETPIVLSNHIDAGRAILNERINTCKQEGLDHELYVTL